jgi:3-hydroxyacyl-CoA dehydrogenase/enoyl-CoA hydratase/3-hydroxybutyryl-CoA epimerase
VFKSAKDAGFIAGANIEEFTTADTPEKARALIQRGWDAYNRLAAVKYPTLALVRGHCMGGGTELALACRYRIAVDEPGTKFALPEVMLGIVPGWGGMLRLPQIVGPAAALDMMLTGKNIDAKRAKKMGLADACVPPRVMENAARMLVLSGNAAAPGATALHAEADERPAQGHGRQAVRRSRWRSARVPGTLPSALRHHRPMAELRRQHAGRAGRQADLARRAGQALDHAQPDPRLLPAGQAQGFRQGAPSFSPQRVHVVGAGVMGGDIAAWCVLRGMTVTLQDQSVERIAPAVGRAATFFEKKLRDRKPRASHSTA